MCVEICEYIPSSSRLILFIWEKNVCEIPIKNNSSFHSQIIFSVESSAGATSGSDPHLHFLRTAVILDIQKMLGVDFPFTHPY